MKYVFGKKKLLILLSSFEADDGNRTHVSSLEGWGNSHYTTSARFSMSSTPSYLTLLIYQIEKKWSIGFEKKLKKIINFLLTKI